MRGKDYKKVYRSFRTGRKVYGRALAAMRKPFYERMDIVLVDFGDGYGNCVVGDFRPAVVISKTDYNMHSPVMQVLPLIRQMKALDKEYHVFVDRNDCDGYEDSGMCMVEQVATVDRRQVRRKIARVIDAGLVEKIDTALRLHLGLAGEAV